MKVSYKWLSEYVRIDDLIPADLAERLTRSGVAVDFVEKRNQDLEGVVVGYVLEAAKHPDAEKLKLCQVDVGSGEPLQIVCGAKNVTTGQKVPVAVVGAQLPGNVKIKRAKLRGVESQGMICSAKELGLNEKLLPKEKTEGILVLPNEAIIGESVEPLLGLDDYVLELDLTPNRADCLSIIGVAYEVGAILNRNVKLPENQIGILIDNSPQVPIAIEAKEACTHYAARLLTDVTIAESPLWLQNRLMASGIRPINNVVDVTNLVLMEYGQPMHAFDLERLEQSKIVVRYANRGEKIVTLDGQERNLDEEMLLITDGIKPIAIAGVMGGLNSELISTSSSILLESACFNGVMTRKTSKKLGLRSEASLRFEKGVDPNRIYLALNRAAELLQEIAGAKLVGDIFEDLIQIPEEQQLTIQPSRVNKLLGTELSEEKIIAIFEQLKFQVSKTSQGILVGVPTRRQDITIEADLIEEVARIYGYDEIPITLPVGSYIQGGLTAKQLLRRKIKDFLGSAGLHEVVSYTFTSKEQDDLVRGLVDNTQIIPLSMPLSEERKYLKTSLIPSLLEVAKYNENRRNANVRIFELGAVFLSDEEKLTRLPEEKLVVGGLLTGVLPKHWQHEEGKLDFYYLKGILEELFAELGITELTYQAVAIEGYHPGRTAELRYKGEDLVGYVGQLHLELQDKYDLAETYVFELDLDKLLQYSNTDITYRSLPRYPAIQRDVALIVQEEIEAAKLMESIRVVGGELLEDLQLFDVYINPQIGNNKKSIAISLTYRSLERTLTDEEVAAVHEKIVNALQDKYLVEIRK